MLIHISGFPRSHFPGFSIPATLFIPTSMILSDSLTIGQITFVLRAAIQILTYGGVALLGLIILGSVPRVAPIDTHDVVNRMVGASSATTSTAKWIFNRLRGNGRDPTSSTNLLIAFFLSISYTVFVSLSDIGFLGFYACSVPGPSIVDSPASVSTNDAARTLIGTNMVTNDTDFGIVKAYRCDAVKTIDFGSNIILNSCTAWRNSTYADTSFFNGINSTDTDVLMPRQLTHHEHPHSDRIDLNSFYIGPNTQRVTAPTLLRGLAVEPHEYGVRAVLGVPQLTSQHKINLPKTLALEVEVGCMALGIYSQHLVEASGSGLDLFATSGNWRKYTGPDYLRDVLSNTTDIIREYYRPFFNTSSLTDGFMFGINETSAGLSSAANIAQYRLPNPGIGLGPDSFIMGNCTEALQRQLGIPISKAQGPQARMCGLLGIGGSIPTKGEMRKGLSRMVCAAATQINMVSATVEVDNEQKVSLNLTRLPSDLNYLRADYWDESTSGNDTVYNTFVPYERFTLNDNPIAPTSHFIAHTKSYLIDNTLGPGSGGNAFSRVGDMILAYDGSLSLAVEYAGLTLLNAGYDPVNLTTNAITRWMGEVGASFILTSVGYNGWGALGSPKVDVLSTGGHTGSCYKPYYALGFFPLLFSATVIICWALLMVINSTLFGTSLLKEGYGGISPYSAVVCPGDSSKDTLLVWESAAQPYLEVVAKGRPVTGDASGTASKYLRARHTYP